MQVELIDHMGSDLSIVNAARVSFQKESEEFSDKDAGLLAFLAKHGHWSPFAHTSLSMRWSAPIYIARQLAKHQVGLNWNEVSRRYVKTQPKLEWPAEWRKVALDVKQGSSTDVFGPKDYGPQYALTQAKNTAERLIPLYDALIGWGVCPEQARMILPQNMQTEWIWTGSLMAFARISNQRTDLTTQAETRKLVLTLDNICGTLFPVAWEVLTQRNK